jgi:hypothetical protein
MMNKEQAKKLKVGDQVYWKRDENDTGIVTCIGLNSVLIDWANGQVGWADFYGMEDIHPIIAPERAKG